MPHRPDHPLPQDTTYAQSAQPRRRLPTLSEMLQQSMRERAAREAGDTTAQGEPIISPAQIGQPSLQTPQDQRLRQLEDRLMREALQNAARGAVQNSILAAAGSPDNPNNTMNREESMIKKIMEGGWDILSTTWHDLQTYLAVQGTRMALQPERTPRGATRQMVGRSTSVSEEVENQVFSQKEIREASVRIAAQASGIDQYDEEGNEQFRQSYIRGAAFVGSAAVDAMLYPAMAAAAAPGLALVGSGAVAGAVYGAMREKYYGESFGGAVAMDAMLGAAGNVVISGVARTMGWVGRRLLMEGSDPARAAVINREAAQAVHDIGPPREVLEDLTGEVHDAMGIDQVIRTQAADHTVAMSAGAIVEDITFAHQMAALADQVLTEHPQSWRQIMWDRIKRVRAMGHPNDVGLIGWGVAPIREVAKKHPWYMRTFEAALEKRQTRAQIEKPWFELIDHTRSKVPAKERLSFTAAVEAAMNNGGVIDPATPAKWAELIGSWMRAFEADRAWLLRQGYVTAKDINLLRDKVLETMAGPYGFINTATKYEPKHVEVMGGTAGQALPKRRRAKAFPLELQTTSFQTRGQAMEFLDQLIRERPDIKELYDLGQIGLTSDFRLPVDLLSRHPNIPHTLLQSAVEADAIQAMHLSQLSRHLVGLSEGKTTGTRQSMIEQLGSWMLGKNLHRMRGADITELAELYARAMGEKLTYPKFNAVAREAQSQISAQEYPLLRNSLDSYISNIQGARDAAHIGLEAYFRQFGMSDREIFGLIRAYEGNVRLGYSPVSVILNLGQTAVNTASKIGWKQTIRGFELFLKAHYSKDPTLKRMLNDVIVDTGIAYRAHLVDAEVWRGISKQNRFMPLYWFSKAEDVNRAIAAFAAFTSTYWPGAKGQLGHSFDIRIPKKREAVIPRQLVETAEAARSRRAIMPERGAVIGDADLEGDLYRQAINFAKDFTNEVHFVYSVEGLPLLMQNPIMQTAFQFKPWLINELYFVSNLRGKEIPRFAINLFAVGGVGAVMSVPPLQLVDKHLGRIHDAYTKRGNDRPTVGAYETMSEELKQAFPMESRGLLGLIPQVLGMPTGLDFERNVSIGGTREMIDFGFGPAVGDVVSLTKIIPVAFQKLAAEVGLRDTDPNYQPEEFTRAVRQLMPAFIRRVTDAFKLYENRESGMVLNYTTGQPMYQTENMWAEILSTATGFRTIERADVDRQIEGLFRTRENIGNDRRNYLERWQRIVTQRKPGWQRQQRTLLDEARDRGHFFPEATLKATATQGFKGTIQSNLEDIPEQYRFQVERDLRSNVPGLTIPRR